MKQVILTATEYYLFKKIANFFYEVSVLKSKVTITADKEKLERLGY
jgi:hypothetical protein